MSVRANPEHPLPEGWELLAGGILVDPEGYERVRKDGSGRLDKALVSLILENSGETWHSRLWRMGRLEAAAPDLLEAAESLSGLWAEWAEKSPFLTEPLRRSIEMRVEEARAAIAKAKGA